MTHMGSYQIQDKYSHALLVIRLESSHTIKVSTSKIHKNKHHIHVEYIYICICICIYMYMYMYIYIYIFIYGASPFFPSQPPFWENMVFWPVFWWLICPNKGEFCLGRGWDSGSLGEFQPSHGSPAVGEIYGWEMTEKPGISWRIWIGDQERKKEVHRSICFYHYHIIIFIAIWFGVVYISFQGVVLKPWRIA